MEGLLIAAKHSKKMCVGVETARGFQREGQKSQSQGLDVISTFHTLQKNNKAYYCKNHVII